MFAIGCTIVAMPTAIVLLSLLIFHLDKQLFQALGIGRSNLYFQRKSIKVACNGRGICPAMDCVRLMMIPLPHQNRCKAVISLFFSVSEVTVARTLFFYLNTGEWLKGLQCIYDSWDLCVNRLYPCCKDIIC